MAGSNVTAVTNLLPRVNEGFISTLGSTISSGAGAVPLTDITGLTNGTTFVGIIEPGGAKEQVFTGTVDTTGSQITGVHWTRGDNVSHSGGVTIVDYITGTAINMLSRWASIQHGADGTHGAITASSAAISGALSAASGSISGDFAVTGNTAFTGTTRSIPVSITSSATVTPTSQIYDVTALATNATIAVPSFTTANGHALILRIMDNGTPRTLSFASGYTNVSGLNTPTTTVASKLLTIGAIYNSTTSKWEIQGISQQA